MSCDSYTVDRWDGRGWAQSSVALNYDAGDEGWPCLCTMNGDSHNGSPWSAEDIASLAAIGAAVVLAHHGHFKGDESITTPAMLPERLTAAIRYFTGAVAASDGEGGDA